MCCPQARRQTGEGNEGDDSGDEIFRVRRPVDASNSATPNLDVHDALDASMLPLSELDLDRWRGEGAAEQLRDRFVTGGLLSGCRQGAFGQGTACLLLDCGVEWPYCHDGLGCGQG
jgi:hypothetical protein